MLLFLIVLPMVVAGGISVLLARREAATSASPATKHTPRAAGFGLGGQAVPIDRGDGLRTLLEPDYYRPWWLRALRLVGLAVLLTAVAAVLAAALYFLGRWAGEALRSFSKG